VQRRRAPTALAHTPMSFPHTRSLHRVDQLGGQWLAPCSIVTSRRHTVVPVLLNDDSRIDRSRLQLFTFRYRWPAYHPGEQGYAVEMYGDGRPFDVRVIRAQPCDCPSRPETSRVSTGQAR